MGFYERRILPHIINCAMNNKDVEAERQRCLAGLAGDVLEIGFGSGLNLPFYPDRVTKVVGIDPSEKSANLARDRIRAARFPVEVIGLSAEQIPIPDASVSTVVSTFTLCTIPDVARALSEIRRVLAPGGHFHFVEHGLSDSAGVRKWQQRLNGINKVVIGGCHLNRPIAALIEQAGFTIEHLENGTLASAPKFAGYLYRGVARYAS